MSWKKWDSSISSPLAIENNFGVLFAQSGINFQQSDGHANAPEVMIRQKVMSNLMLAFILGYSRLRGTVGKGREARTSLVQQSWNHIESLITSNHHPDTQSPRSQSPGNTPYTCRNHPASIWECKESVPLWVLGHYSIKAWGNQNSLSGCVCLKIPLI